MPGNVTTSAYVSAVRYQVSSLMRERQATHHSESGIEDSGRRFDNRLITATRRHAPVQHGVREMISQLKRFMAVVMPSVSTLDTASAALSRAESIFS